MKPLASPLEGKTINRRAGCGRPASLVRREGEETLPTPIMACGLEFAKSMDSGPSPERVVADLNSVMRGWFEYFKHSRARTVGTLDGWMRRRLRSMS
jgi:Group II intron, maturase-specific domain